MALVQSGPVVVVFYTALTTSLTTTRKAVCSGGEWRCNNGNCIPSVFKCDGLNQCGDNSDEQEGCFDLSGACGSGRMCRSILKCVSRHRLCDGVDDCGDNSDETNCSLQSSWCQNGEPLVDQHGQAINCGQGTARTCPANSACHVDSHGRFSVCCPI